MFIYLLIAAELAVLYTVFWYLYLREPKCSRRIKGSMWGTYADAMSEGQFDPTLPSFIRGDQQIAAYFAQYHAEGWQLPNIQQELVLDQLTNRYVPLAQTQSNMVARMAAKFDDTCSQLNVRS